jgi:SAM-dependent methyltransferase
MGLALHALKALAPYLRNASVLSLGYPDILATAEECKALFGVDVAATIEGGAQHRVERPLVETEELFFQLGSTLECVDSVAWRGCERVVDLNYSHQLGAFDLVIDAGTIEHCFNIGQAIMNAASAVKPNGHIYHSPPMTMINHGFYNICPTLFQDFYTQNGWRIETLEARMRDQFVAIDERGAMSRRAKVSMETGLVCIARRKTGARLIYPQQAKYVAMQQAMQEAA